MEKDFLELPFIPTHIKHNAHMFYIKTKNAYIREQLANYLKNNNIMAVSHYVPLHSSLAGKKLGVFVGEDRYTTTDSERLLRLPLYYDIKVEDVNYVISCIKTFFNA